MEKIGYLWALETRGNSWKNREAKRSGSWMSNLKVGESMTEERGARPISLVSGAEEELLQNAKKKRRSSCKMQTRRSYCKIRGALAKKRRRRSYCKKKRGALFISLNSRAEEKRKLLQKKGTIFCITVFHIDQYLCTDAFIS